MSVMCGEGVALFNVRRQDNVVHIVESYSDTHGINCVPEHRRGIVQGGGGVAWLFCGRAAKLTPFSKNRIVTDAPTCFVCMVGGYADNE